MKRGTIPLGALAVPWLICGLCTAACGGSPKATETPKTRAAARESRDPEPLAATASANAAASEPPGKVRTPEEKRLEEEVRRAADGCGPTAKWSDCEDAIAALKAARRKETTVSDGFLLDLFEGERSGSTRRVLARLFLDLDRASPLLGDPALASRLVDAADRETDRDTSSILTIAIGNVDLEATKLDDRIRDFGLARKEFLGGNFPWRVVHNAKSSPRAARVVGAWLASPPSTFRRVVQISVSTEANDSNGAAFCAAMLEVAKNDPSSQRVLDAVLTGEGCTKAQRNAAKAALGKQRSP